MPKKLPETLETLYPLIVEELREIVTSEGPQAAYSLDREIVLRLCTMVALLNEKARRLEARVEFLEGHR